MMMLEEEANQDEEEANENKKNREPMKRLNGKIIQLIEKIIFWMNNYETKK